MKHRLLSLALATMVVATPFAQEKIDKDIQWKIRREATDNSQIMNSKYKETSEAGLALSVVLC